jgi:hypothetical protein
VRRAAVLLVAVFLVNLPFVHQSWTGWQIARDGVPVRATVLDQQHVGDSYLLDYQLPRASDPGRTRFSDRVDRPTYDRARETGQLLVRVVPGRPGANEPVGAVPSHLFAVVALIGDLILVLIGVAAYRRWRRRTQHVVVSVHGDEVGLDSPLHRVTVVGPDGWAGGLELGQRVSGRLHLTTDEEVLPGSFVGGLEQVDGASYVVRGRVVDARAGRLVLELEDHSRLRVETGAHRIRADVREPTEVRGTLCFTPYR